MNRPTPKTVRRRFFIALGHAIHVTWPVLSAILAIQVTLGLLIGFVEGWSVATQSISHLSPASQLVMAISCRGRRLRGAPTHTNIIRPVRTSSSWARRWPALSPKKPQG
jgi:hypothetical protein